MLRDTRGDRHQADSTRDNRPRSSRRRSLRTVWLATSALIAWPALTMVSMSDAPAATLTWTGATSGDYDNATNWTPGAVPGAADTALFSATTRPSVLISISEIVGGWTFDGGASAYTFNVIGSLFFKGPGITINGGSVDITNNIAMQFLGSSTAAGNITNNANLSFLETSTAGSAGIVNNGSLRFFDASSGGNVEITNAAAGLVEFRGTSAAGHAGITNNGILRFFDASRADNASIINTASTGFIEFRGASGAGSASITNNGSLNFFDTSTAGSATIANADATGFMEFHDAATAGSANIMNRGSLQFFNTTTAGNANIVNHGTLLFEDSSSAGSATITIFHHGVAFDGRSTAANATIINNDELGFGGFSTAANATITNNATAAFGDTATAGNATLTNAGNMFFRDTSTAGNARITNVNNGSIAFNGTSTAGSAAIFNNGDLLFANSASAGRASILNSGLVEFDSVSTGGNASITNNNLVKFTQTSTGGNANIDNNNVVRFQDRSTGGNMAITNSANATVDFSPSSGLNNDHKLSIGSLAGGGTFSLGSNELTIGGNNNPGVVTGIIADGGLAGGTGGSLVQAGGRLTLAGVNTYTGPTTVNNGLLTVNGSIASSSLTRVSTHGILSGTGIVGNTTIAAGGTLASGNGNVLGSQLVVAGNLAFQSGAQYLVQLSQFAASTTVISGTASLGGDVLIVPGSFISRRYPILSAGGGISGTFNAPLAIGLPLDASLSYDAHNVVLNLQLSFTAAQGGFSSNQQSLADVLTKSFNANDGINSAFALATRTPAGLTQISGEGATSPQQTTFGAMTQFMNLVTDPFVDGRGGEGGFYVGNSGNGGAGGFFGGNGGNGGDGGFYGGTGGNGGNTGGLGGNAGNRDLGGRSDISGDTSSAYASESPGVPGSLRKGRERDAYAAMSRKAPVQDTFTQRWNVWATAYGGSQTTDGNVSVGSNATTSRIVGTAVGADYRFSPYTVAGFALGAGGTNFVVANGLGGGRSDLFQAGAFVNHSTGPAYITAALAYGWQDVTTNRTLTVVGVDQLQAEFNTNTFTGRVEGGYRFVAPSFGGVGMTPYAAGQVTTVMLPAYAESAVAGSNTFALSYAAKDVTATRSELGLRTDKTFVLQNSVLTLRGRAAWAHDFNSDRSVAATFQSLPGASFTVNGATGAPDAALTTASVEAKWRNGWSAAAAFEGEFSSVTRSYAGKGTVRYAW